MNKQITLSIALIVALVGFPQISETIYTPSLPNLAASLSATASAAESTLAVYFFGFAFGVLIWGALSDKWGRRVTMLTGILIYILATIFCALSENIENLMVWRFIQAFGASVGSVITQTILRDIYQGHERGRIFAIVGGCLAFSPAIGPFIGSLLSGFFGWRVNFIFLTAMGVGIYLWSYFKIPETKSNNIEIPSLMQLHNVFKKMFSNSNLWSHVILIGASNGLVFSFYQEAPFIFIENLGMRESYYGILGVLIAAATLVASRISFKLAQQLGPENLVQKGTYLVVLGNFIWLLTVSLGLFSFSSFGMIIALSSLFLSFLGVGLIMSNSLSIALKPYANALGTAGSYFGAAYYIVTALCTGLMSFLHNGSLFTLPLYLFCLGVSLVLAARGIRRQNPQTI